MKRALVGMAAVFGLVGCGGGPEAAPSATPTPTPTEETIEVTGTMSLPSTGWFATTIALGEACTGEGGYDDIRAGAQVVVRDGAGETVAIDQLEGGTIEDGADCVFPFSVPDVPGDREFYSVEVAARGELEYSRAEIEQVLAFNLN